MVPWGLRRLLKWVTKTYNNPPIYVTENGISDSTGTLDDQPRIDFYKGYINEVLKGMCQGSVYYIQTCELNCDYFNALSLILLSDLGTKYLEKYQHKLCGHWG